MTVLNKDTLYYLATWNKDAPYKEIRNDAFIWNEYERNTNLYYGVEFMSDMAFDIFPLDTIFNEDQLKQIRTGDASLVLYNSHEAFHGIIPGLYEKIVIRYNIPPNNVILISESADIKTAVDAVSLGLSLPAIKTKWSRRFEYDTHTIKYWSDSPFVPWKNLGQFPFTLSHKQYDKKYLCFNRRWRTHRPLLVALLYAFGLLQYGHVSLGKSDDNLDWQTVYPQLLSLTSSNTEVNKILHQVENQIKQLEPLYLDDEDLVTNKADLSNTTHSLYDDTYFSVVTETNFFTKDEINTGRFISEKTFKPIVYRHPFIVVTVPRFLEKLREIGYKTFSPFINEDYDLELDDSLRILKIVKEIDRLSKLSNEELFDFLEGIKPICEFNYRRLMTATSFVTTF